MRPTGFTFVAAVAVAGAGVLTSVRAADCPRAAATAQTTQNTAGTSDPVLRLAVWSAVRDARKAGGTAQDVADAVAEATAWWQSVQPSLTSEDWLLADVARVAAREVIQNGGSVSDLFSALDEVVTWWQGVEPTLPATEDRLFRFVIGMTLEGVEQKGGTLRQALTAVDGALAALAEMSGNSNTAGGSGTSAAAKPIALSPSAGAAQGPATSATKLASSSAAKRIAGM